MARIFLLLLSMLFPSVAFPFELDTELYCSGIKKSIIVNKVAFEDKKISWNITFNEEQKRLYVSESSGKICLGRLLSEELTFNENSIIYGCHSAVNYDEVSDENASLSIDRKSGVLNYLKRNVSKSGTLQFSAEMNCIKKTKQF
jgi:hypothetical protein